MPDRRQRQSRPMSRLQSIWAESGARTLDGELRVTDLRSQLPRGLVATGERPRLSWRLSGGASAVEQRGYEVQAARSSVFEELSPRRAPSGVRTRSACRRLVPLCRVGRSATTAFASPPTRAPVRGATASRSRLGSCTPQTGTEKRSRCLRTQAARAHRPHRCCAPNSRSTHPAPRPPLRHVPWGPSRPPQWRSGRRRSARSGLDDVPAAFAGRRL